MVLMARWQAIALNIKPKRKSAEYMDLRIVNEAMAEFGQKKRQFGISRAKAQRRKGVRK